MFSKALPSLLVALVLASLTSAHFTLNSPKSRIIDEAKETSFCGGVPTLTESERTDFPLSAPATVSITSYNDTAHVAIILSVERDPTELSHFKTKGKFNYLMNFVEIKGQETFTFTVNISHLKDRFQKSPLKAGDYATIQVEYNGGGEPLYQCADVILV
ncbi:uncharacterized protein MELLADRAFT_124097 [Melampsora larici-populina 98AG31]|uniref:Copper acquisition factor BIM1-like domain-containing protein n=1 Tax=Melampsora larici-populina (strain 98AG31 / pathotype 3-4-7) TaxID=747676 RepID=F4S0H3_MELLP|nr:uncharacterized protein MELLADRAFT_124097 [Melampsora larici-populina 98AG31]EGG01768.1 hypothetical protein MELLADRAFT_124097 [Melampsora larici-populina 98AG31]